MTYGELTAAILGWIRRPEAEQAIPSFITLAEAQISRRLAQAGVTGAVARAAITLDAEYVPAPADFGIPISMKLAGGEAVALSTAFGLDALAAALDFTAAPTRFAVVGGEIRLQPAPDRAYTAELTYQARLSALTVLNTVNWLSAAHPDAYLYGALAQAEAYLGEARAGAFAVLFDAAINEVVRAERAKRGSAATPAFRTDTPLTGGAFNINTGNINTGV